MKAISLWNPWATLLAYGLKRYETRAWSTSHRGPVAIHAGLRWTRRMQQQCYEEPFFTMLHALGVRFPASLHDRRGGLPRIGLAFGAVVAVANLVDVIPTADVLPQLGPGERAFGDFSHGRYAWRYADVVRLEPPVACTGRQGVFTLEPAIEQRIKDQLRGAIPR